MKALSNRPDANIGWLKTSPKKRKITQNDEPLVKRPRGRPPLRSFYPNIVDTAKAFIEGNRFKAHRRRQEDTGTCGSTLKQIKEHLLHTVPDLNQQRPHIGRYLKVQYLFVN